MTREEAKSCIGTIKILRTLAYNIHGVMDVIDADNCEKIIQALSQEPTDKPMCDRNICLSNEYNGIGCDECIVNKAEQEPMREFTKEEAKAYSKALDKMYKPTGFNIFDEYGNYKYPSDVELAEPNMATSIPCEDAISREAVIELIERSVGNKSVTIDGFTFGKSLMLYHVKQLPSVTQKSGKWKQHGIGFRCSNCGIQTSESNVKAGIMKYCPNCGACMKDGRTLDEFIEDSKERSGKE